MGRRGRDGQLSLAEDALMTVCSVVCEPSWALGFDQQCHLDRAIVQWMAAAPPGAGGTR